MASHAAPEGSVTRFPSRPDAVSHHKPITVIATNTTRAVASSDHEIVISEDFADAVRVAYIGGRVAEACGGATDRLIELVTMQLCRNRRLPKWSPADVEVVVSYLADQNQILLPKLLLAVAS